MVSQMETDITAIDPVCGMTVSTQSDFFSEYKGHVYYFCSPQDKAEFDRHPADYVQKVKMGIPEQNSRE